MYTRQEMIEIGDLLKSWDDFGKKLYCNIIPDPRSGRKYTQVRTRIKYGKNKSKWYSKYVGPTERYTPQDLKKATEFITQQHRDFVNSELAKFNCQIDDFPIKKL